MPVERVAARRPDTTVDPGPSLRALTVYLERLAARPDQLSDWQQTKCYGELALIHHYLRSWVREGSMPRQPFAAQLAVWADHLTDHCNRIHPEIDGGPDDLSGRLYHLQPYLWLRAAGYRSAPAEEMLARLARAGARPDSIGLYYCLWKAGLVRRQPDWRAALPRWLALWGETAESWDHSDYLITHAAFYVTDFGNHPAPVEPSDLDRLARINQQLLRRSVARSAWDLVGEGLIALACLARDQTAEYDQATRRFCQARRTDGPHAGWGSYHTTLVDVLRCATALRAAGRPSRHRGEQPAIGGTAMDTDVAVVGAGPVGLTLAAELHAWGVSSIVLEARPTIDERLRAPSITARTIEALERHRLLDRLVERIAWYEGELGRHTDVRPDLRVDGVRSLPIRQELLERVLDAHVRAVGVDLRRGWRVTGVTTADGSVELRVVRPDSRTQTLTARYTVGCDGGRSVIRDSAGIAFPGVDPTVTGYQAEVVLAGTSTLPQGWHRTQTGIFACERHANGLVNVVSIEFAGPPPDPAAPVTLGEVEASLRRISRSEVLLTEAKSLTRFTDNERLAEAYRSGRVLLAGDAAHVQAPFGGQGLNLGVQDAANLGWKLAAAVQGWAQPDLLDSYTAERRPVAEQVQRMVRGAVTLLDPARSAAWELFHELQRLDTARRHMHGKTAMVNVRYDIGDPAGVPHPLLGQAPRDLELQGPAGRNPLSRLMRAGRGLLLMLPRADRAAAEVAAPWRDRVDLAAAAVHPASAQADLFDGDVRSLLLRPDGFVVWVGTSAAGPSTEKSLRTTLQRWYGPASRRSTGRRPEPAGRRLATIP
jgi:2-polyprenyl-6-methoxyphenol hydroxylase-like FAD-dependent oxidoreductase